MHEKYERKAHKERARHLIYIRDALKKQDISMIQLSQKKFDFTQKPMKMPPIPFRGLETAKKGVSIAFLLLAVTNSGS